MYKYFYVIVFVKIWSSNISLSLQIHIKGDSYLNLIKHSFFVFTESTMRTIQSSNHKVCGTQCLFVQFPCLFLGLSLALISHWSTSESVNAVTQHMNSDISPSNCSDYIFLFFKRQCRAYKEKNSKNFSDCKWYELFWKNKHQVNSQ